MLTLQIIATSLLGVGVLGLITLAVALETSTMFGTNKGDWLITISTIISSIFAIIVIWLK